MFPPEPSPIGQAWERNPAIPTPTLAARRRLFFLSCLLPTALYVVLVAGLPLVQGLWYSLFDYNLLRPGRSSFAGLSNYACILGDPTARAAIVNTFLFTALAVSLELALGLILALLLWRDGVFERIALALLLIPVSITPLAVGLAFRALLSAEFGYVATGRAIWALRGSGASSAIRARLSPPSCSSMSGSGRR